MYPSRERAEQALIQAWVKNDYPPGKGPVTVYHCNDCREFHLTSAGALNPALEVFIKEGKLKLQKEADYWASKLKK